MFPPDFKELLSVFNSRKVRYLLIGGYAVSLHTQPRTTKVLDLLVSPDAGNAKALFAALAEFGAPLEAVKEQDFMEPNMFFPYGRTAPHGGDSPADPRRGFRKRMGKAGGH